MLTRDLHSKGVPAHANNVKSHAFNCHPLAGRPHSEDALHFHSPILFPLNLHSGSLEWNRQLQACGVFIAPVSPHHTVRRQKKRNMGA